MSDGVHESAKLFKRAARQLSRTSGIFQHENDAGLNRCKCRLERAANRAKRLSAIARSVRSEMSVDEAHPPAGGDREIVLQQMQRAGVDLRICAAKVDEIRRMNRAGIESGFAPV